MEKMEVGGCIPTSYLLLPWRGGLGTHLFGLLSVPDASNRGQWVEDGWESHCPLMLFWVGHGSDGGAGKGIAGPAVPGWHWGWLWPMVAVSTELYKALAGAPAISGYSARVFWQGFACFTSPYPKNRQGVWDEGLEAKDFVFRSGGTDGKSLQGRGTEGQSPT